jgi:hypothetical protein
MIGMEASPATRQGAALDKQKPGQPAGREALWGHEQVGSD